MTSWSYGAGGQTFQIRGQGGADKLGGGNGSDQLCGGSGNDGTSSVLVDGKGGADDIDGGTGNDYLDGGTGSSDYVYGYDGADYVLDTSGSADRLFGEAGNESCVMDGDNDYTEINCHTDPTTCGTADGYNSDVVGHSTPWCTTNNIIACNTQNTGCWLF